MEKCEKHRKNLDKDQLLSNKAIKLVSKKTKVLRWILKQTTLVFHDKHFCQIWQIFEWISTPCYCMLIIWWSIHNLASIGNIK